MPNDREHSAGRAADDTRDVRADGADLREELALARIAVTRLEERLAVASDLRAAVEASAKAEVGAAKLAAKAEIEAMLLRLETEVAARNAVIETLREEVQHERTERAKLAAELAEARKPMLLRLVEAIRRK